MLLLGLIFMVGFSYLAIQVILWQDQDISVDIVSETDDGASDVVISVQNTAGSTLLFYENDEITGKLEYLTEDGWIEYCDVCYTDSNTHAISQQYGGTFAELDAGEEWNVVIPRDVVSKMANGTYRVKFTYITEKKFNQYLDSEFKNSLLEEDTSVEESIGDISDIGKIENLSGSESIAVDESEEEFLAASRSEVFIKTFEFESADEYFSENINAVGNATSEALSSDAKHSDRKTDILD